MPHSWSLDFSFDISRCTEGNQRKPTQWDLRKGTINIEVEIPRRSSSRLYSYYADCYTVLPLRLLSKKTLGYWDASHANKKGYCVSQQKSMRVVKL